MSPDDGNAANYAQRFTRRLPRACAQRAEFRGEFIHCDRSTPPARSAKEIE